MPLSKSDRTFHFEFPEKKKAAWNELADWYKKKASDSTKINKLEIRKNSRFTTLTHRFVVLRMCGNDASVHRLDRSARRRHDVAGLSRTALLTANTKTETIDEMVVDLNAEEIEEVERNALEVEISLNGQVDLLDVISTCYAISVDDHGGQYDLFNHNCFFFSWTIAMVSSRICIQHRTPEQGPLLDSFKERGKSDMVEFTVKKGVHAFREMIVQAMIIFRDRQQANDEYGIAFRKGMPYISRMMWALPRWLFEAAGRTLYGAKLHGGLRRRLNDYFDKELDEKIKDLYLLVLDNIGPPDACPGVWNKDLWVDRVEDLIRPAVEDGLMNTLWPVIEDVVTEGLSKDIDEGTVRGGGLSLPELGPRTDTPGMQPDANNGASSFTGSSTASPDEIDAWILGIQVRKSRGWHVLGRRTTQLLAVQAAAMHGGMMGVKKVASSDVVKRIKEEVKEASKGDNSKALKSLNERMFDLVWGSAQQGALDWAKKAVSKTMGDIDFTDKEREARNAQWDAIWEIWDDSWNEARSFAQKKVLLVLGDIAEKNLQIIVQLIIGELKSGAVQPRLDVRILGSIAAKLPLIDISANDSKKMTILELQDYMERMMKKAKLGDIKNLQTTMARVWDVSRKFKDTEVGKEFITEPAPRAENASVVEWTVVKSEDVDESRAEGD